MTLFKDVLSNPSQLYFIGEISCNHNNCLKTLLKTVDKLVDVGADAVKIQTDAIDGTGSTMDFRTPCFTVDGGTIWDGKNLMDLYKEAYTPLEWHKDIFDYCSSVGIECFSTPYSDSTIDFLSQFNMPAIKVASMEAADLGFVRRCASLQVPIIISTGMINFEEARAVVKVCRDVGNFDITLLKCVSEYPASPADMHLLTIPKLKDDLNVIVGLSDHTLTHTSSIVSTVLGARVFEKHVKLDDTIFGPDASFSLTVDQFGDMIELCKEAKSTLGTSNLLSKSKNPSYSRSIFVVRDVRPGEVISSDNIRIIRPGYGMSPNDWDLVIGNRFALPVKAGFPLLPEHVMGLG